MPNPNDGTETTTTTVEKPVTQTETTTVEKPAE